MSKRFATIQRGSEILQVEESPKLEAEYAGCTILERDLPAPTQEAPVRKAGKWANDAAHVAGVRKGAAARHLSREALVERLDALEARLTALEGGANAPNG